MNKLKYIGVLLLSAIGIAQQPQTQSAPLSSINVKYVNGVAPGYSILTNGNSLTIVIGPGTSFCSGVINQYAGGTLSLTASTTNNIYLNTSASCAPSVKLTPFTTTDIPLAQVVTNPAHVTSITDLRTFFVPPGTGGGGGGGVGSVFGRSGNVTAQANDYNFNQLAGSLGNAQGPTGLTGILKDSGGTLSVATPHVDYAVPNDSTTGSAGSLSAVSALPNGTTATTQIFSDNTTKVATTQYVTTAVAAGGGSGHPSVGAPGAMQAAGTGGAFSDSGCTNPTSGTVNCNTLQSSGSGGVAGGFDYTEGTTNAVAATGHVRFQALNTHEPQISISGSAYSDILFASSNTVACIPTTFGSLTDGATVTWATASVKCANTSLVFTTHGGSRTLNLTGLVDGGSYVLYLQQDATGGEGLVLGTGCTWKVSGGGAGTITPSTGANAVDVLAFTVRGTTCLANFNTNFN